MSIAARWLIHGRQWAPARRSARMFTFGGAGIGGGLNLCAGPVIIEDDRFIGARSEVVEGVVVERGAVLSMGVFIGASTKIVDRETGDVHIGRVPAYSVVVPGTLPGKPLPDGTRGQIWLYRSSSRLMRKHGQRPRSTICCGTDKTRDDNTPARTSPCRN